MDVIIGLCTYKRPDYLRECLASLATMRVPEQVNLTIAVVDNEVSSLNKEIVEALGYYYLPEPKSGVTYARNALLDFAADSEADYLGIIDDDETVPTDWLQAMLTSMDETQADAISGPVNVCIPNSAPKSLKYAYQFSKVKDYKSANTLPMGNVFLKTSLLREGLRFDLRFNHSGGEDVDFFRRASANGARLFRSPYGEVIESLTPEKASLSAFFKRVMRVSSIHYKEKYPTFSVRFFIEILLSVIEVCIFLVLAPIALFSDKFKVKWLKVVAKFFGRLLSRKNKMLHYYG